MRPATPIMLLSILMSAACIDVKNDLDIEDDDDDDERREGDRQGDCNDGEDNDGNGYTDCDDRECTALGADVCPVEDTFELCSYGIDNDGNGYVDCEDFGCRNDSFGFVTVCDNYSSGGSNCVPTGGGTEVTLAECSDGLDNDCNGYTDCDDFSCSRSNSAEILEYCDVAGGEP